MSYSPLDYPATRAQELWEDQQQEEREAEARELALSVAEYLDRQHAEATAEYDRLWEKHWYTWSDVEAFFVVERRVSALWDALTLVRERNGLGEDGRLV